MMDHDKLEDIGNKVGMLFALADEIDLTILDELIRLSEHPMAKVMMPLIAEQLKKETGLKAIPTTEMTEAMKLLAFFLVELKKVGFGKAIAEAKGGGL
jgi:hypothetical protein